MSKKSKKSTEFNTGGGTVEKTLKGFSTLLGKLTELAEAGEQLKHSDKFQGKTAQGNDFQGSYGVTVKTGLLDTSGESACPVPVNKTSQKKSPAKKPSQKIREPQVDVFEEPDCVLVVAEMPGIEKEDLNLILEQDILTLSATRGEKKYRKEVLLPDIFSREKMHISVRNGVVDIKFKH